MLFSAEVQNLGLPCYFLATFFVTFLWLSCYFLATFLWFLWVWNVAFLWLPIDRHTIDTLSACVAHENFNFTDRR
jgi:hypothetical protein